MRYEWVQKEKGNPGIAFLFVLSVRLLPEIELLDQGAVLLDVLCLKVVEQSASLTYEIEEGGLCAEILPVVLEMAGQVVDAVREQSDLSFRAARVGLRTTVFLENAFLNF